jgi:hypothetical protein
VEKWNSGQISQIGSAAAPSEPGRPDNVKIIPGMVTRSSKPPILSYKLENTLELYNHNTNIIQSHF